MKFVVVVLKKLDAMVFTPATLNVKHHDMGSNTWTTSNAKIWLTLQLEPGNLTESWSDNWQGSFAEKKMNFYFASNTEKRDGVAV